MKTWNTLENVRGVGLAAIVATMSLATSAALAQSITSEPYSGPVAGGPAPESMLVADFEGDLPVGISFLPAPTIVKGDSVAPGNRSMRLGQDPMQAPATQILFDAEALGGIAPRFAGFVVTESAGFGAGVPAPIAVTVWFADGSSETANFNILSEGSDSLDDMLIRVDSKLGVAQITVASVIPISIDNVMYESNAAPLPDRYVQDDVNGDGKSDSAWYRTRRVADDTAVSTVWLWGATSYTNLAPSLAAPSLRAKMVGMGDANGDKRADLLWHDARSGSLWVWMMGGIATSQQLVDRTVTGGWKVVDSMTSTATAARTSCCAAWSARPPRSACLR